jgi:hypothetical protein
METQVEEAQRSRDEVRQEYEMLLQKQKEIDQKMTNLHRQLYPPRDIQKEDNHFQVLERRRREAKKMEQARQKVINEMIRPQGPFLSRFK